MKFFGIRQQLLLHMVFIYVQNAMMNNGKRYSVLVIFSFVK